MKKTSKKSVSSSEYALIEKASHSGMASFTADEAAKLMGWEKSKAYKITSGLKRKGVAEAVSGRYVLSSIYGGHDIYAVASNLVWPSYISFWTALSHYKYTEQLPRTIYLASTRQKKDLHLEEADVKFVKIAASRFFGYRKTDDVTIAEKEKALIDSLLLPRYAGGIAEVEKCLKNAWGEIDRETLVQYALRMGNKSLLKRLGYLTEANGLYMEDELLRELETRIGKGYSKLDPQLPKRGEYNDRWKLIVNNDVNTGTA